MADSGPDPDRVTVLSGPQRIFLKMNEKLKILTERFFQPARLCPAELTYVRH